ncbi:Phospholipase D1 [Ceratocystis pirilliformis]|uniref:phospholipase D n=1 Tax=Ceratocystis pirilliformis TaxID=259994 RepID=A0ABR3YW00_9PEZI
MEHQNVAVANDCPSRPKPESSPTPQLDSQSLSSQRPELMQERIDMRDYGSLGRSETAPSLGDSASRTSHSYRNISPLALPPLNIKDALEDRLQESPSTVSALSQQTATATTAAVSAVSDRRNVQFAGPSAPSHSRQASWEENDASRHLASSFMSKLKSLGLQSPRSTSGVAGSSTPQSRSSSPNNSRTLPVSIENDQSCDPALAASVVGETDSNVNTGLDNDADADADAEETADETMREDGDSKKTLKKKRKIRRPRLPEWASSPNASEIAPVPLSAGLMMRHRGSLPGLGEEAERWSAVVSEGEGRERLEKKKQPHKRNHISRASGTEAGLSSRRGHMRRLTSFGGGIDTMASGAVSDIDGATTPRRNFFSHERAATLGAQGWHMVKSTLKMLRSKRDDRFNMSKSAELISELQAGAPAAMLLATYMQRDEHGNKRIPVLLEQLQLNITDSKHRPEDDSERHSIFTISMIYGSGPSSMQWTITRTLSDIYQLHLRYRVKTTTARQEGVLARYRQPKFPSAIFPWFRSFRSHGDESDEEEEAGESGQMNLNGREGGRSKDNSAENPDMASLPPLEEPPRIHDQQSRRPSSFHSRSYSRSHSRSHSLSNLTDDGGSGVDDIGIGASYSGQLAASATRRRHVDRQRKALEKYFREMIKWLMIRPDSNRMCRFLELSALGVRLAAEGSHHGKECYLHIQSSKGLDFRRVLTPGKVIARHSRKWFLVRQSYIVCVESPENMNVYDVYLVDAAFDIGHKRKKKLFGRGGSTPVTPVTPVALDDEDSEKGEGPINSGKHHRMTLYTSERKVKLFSRNHSVIQQFEASVREMLATTPWHQPNRFDSFGPVRHNVYAQWLVDGRDYMWNVSRAIQMARDVIYIHDWWLSPELYMRRPAAISQKWRLDRLLQRKAQEGVKVFVIVYRNVEAAIPIDSTHTKFSLLNLHPNIFIQRSPHQFKKNQFIYAHHEKLVIVDHDIAFLGGIDLCFGRWDSPQHPLTDDRPTGFEPPKEDPNCPSGSGPGPSSGSGPGSGTGLPLHNPSRYQMFPGKDYSNPRVQDFYRLNEPYEEMYDRSRVPRMPWHDVAMQIVGQPARDLTRHFVQRWNYIRRGRKATRPLPFLLPPPDAKLEQLEQLGLTGTCEVQLLRSAGNWSLGTNHTEHSIQNAYIKMIEDSDHFVYMENQFFVTSTEFDGVRIMNRIGDALVARAIRAHRENQDWRCVIIIPLMPGFQNTVDNAEGTSIRLILESQYRSISRGPHSIFGRLGDAGINAEDYIQFYSLRQWGKMENGVLVTEQLYIHAKIIIVDDRVALIGSANINERSMLGDRDSEVAAIVRDTDLIDSHMAGKPYQVGRFAHTLRMRLMREHLGLDVDEILEEDLAAEMEQEEQDDEFSCSGSDITGTDSMFSEGGHHHGNDEEVVELEMPAFRSRAHPNPNSNETDNHDVITEDHGIPGKTAELHKSRGRSNTNLSRGRRPSRMSASSAPSRPSAGASSTRPEQTPGPAPTPSSSHPLAADITLAPLHKDCMRDPVAPEFIDKIWNHVAANNTTLYRRVFRCMPDNEVSTWNDYRDYMDYAQRFMQSMESNVADNRPSGSSHDHINHPTIDLKAAAHAANEARNYLVIDDNALSGAATATDGSTTTIPSTSGAGPPLGHLRVPLNIDTSGSSIPTSAGVIPNPADGPSPVLPAGDTPFPPLDPSTTIPPATPDGERSREKRTTFSTPSRPPTTGVNGMAHEGTSGTGAVAPQAPLSTSGTLRKRKRTNTKGSRHRNNSQNPLEVLPQHDAEELLGLMQGPLVQFPYDWLLTEENKRNWGYQVDHVAPLQI